MTILNLSFDVMKEEVVKPNENTSVDSRKRVSQCFYHGMFHIRNEISTGFVTFFLVKSIKRQHQNLWHFLVIYTKTLLSGHNSFGIRISQGQEKYLEPRLVWLPHGYLSCCGLS